MKNKKIWLGLIILVFAFIVSGCDIFEELITVPDWARGTWYTAASGITRVKAITITDKELIPESTFSLVPSRTDFTIASGDTATFGVYEVIKVSPNQITIGITGTSSTAAIPLYK